uniref:Leucine rich immune protein (Coil-less) n=1 Tax=Anopheles maculatus TaxID=74869 RepID=A0A182S655_9DIPT
MKLLLLSTLIFGYTSTIDIDCDKDYLYCIVKQLNIHQLQHLPERLLEKRTNLVVKQSFIHTLDVHTLHPNLYELSLVKCEIDKLILPQNCTLDHLIIEETIGSLQTFPNKQLSFLSVIKSPLSGLYPAIRHMTALVNIRLQEMHISTFNLDILHGKPKLFSVELNFNRIKALHLSPNQTCCETLSELDLSCNRLTEIDLDLFNRMEALKKLRFESNRIAALNGTLDLRNLIELDFSTNRLQTIDLCRWKIESLRLLNVDNNRIRHLLNCIEKLKNLISFRIGNNFLHELDVAQFAMLSITYFNFECNQIGVVHNQHMLPRNTCFVLHGNPVCNSTEYCNGLGSH